MTDNDECELSWNSFYTYRNEVRRKYSSVYEIKIKKKLHDIVIEESGEGYNVLDVGANDRSQGDKIIAAYPTAVYETMDIDRNMPHDYYSLEEIEKRFDMIILSEVIEHLEFKPGISMLHKLIGLLKSGGKIIVSTPNMNHPNRYWDSDHRTPYRYDEICAALMSVGFSIKNVYRTYNDQFFRRLFRMYVGVYLHKYLDVDFAKSIVVVASKE